MDLINWFVNLLTKEYKNAVRHLIDLDNFDSTIALVLGKLNEKYFWCVFREWLLIQYSQIEMSWFVKITWELIDNANEFNNRNLEVLNYKHENEIK